MAKQTLEQQRAESAWLSSQGYEKDQVNAAKGYPTLIMNSGLMQTLAFSHEKEKAHEQISQALRDWLAERFPNNFENSEFNTVMQALMIATPSEYKAIHTEALAWLRWLRQMAAARVKGE